jgi:hypothetical protein
MTNIPIVPQIGEPIGPNSSLTVYPESWLATPATLTDAVSGTVFKNSLLNLFADKLEEPFRLAKKHAREKREIGLC